MKKGNMIVDAVILCIITLVLGAILAGVYTITKKPIEDAQAKANNEACAAVVVSGDAVKNTVATGQAVSYFETHDLSNQEVKKGEESAELLSNYVVINEIHPTEKGGTVYLADALKGYGGKISFALGVDQYGATTGISITSQSETAGLGARCEEEEFQKGFVDIIDIDESSELYAKEEPEINTTTDPEGRERNLRSKVQAITGATVTSRAITRAVKGIIFYHYDAMQNAAANEGGAQ